MPMHYVLVADAARARILAGGDTLDDLRQLQAVEHDTHEHEHERFGHELARLLGDAYKQHAFERLILVAPPKFLGILRDVLDGQTRKAVVASVAHDLTHVGLDELSGAIRSHLPVDAGMP